jgi:hypothetical protein
MKKVLLIIIDALATRVVEPALQEGNLPNLQRLAEAGVFVPECFSIFPSITPAATCSLCTGAYPFEHGVSGAYWYDADKDEVAYFGDDLLAILNEGVGNYLNDFQIKMNMERLRVPTIFERVEEQGLQDAVINYLWYRGNFEQKLSTPLLLKLMPGVSFADSMRGPERMYLGDFVATELEGKRPKAKGGMTRRFGFHDDSTADYLLQLAKKNALADFTLAYFPNNDFDSHSEGPKQALGTLTKVDGHLGELFDAAGGLQKLLSEYAVLVTGDHSQSDLDEEPGINLDDVLKDFHLVEAGAPWREDEDLMACPNMRAAQIYLRPGLWARRDDVTEALLKSDEIDQVIWCDSDGGLNESPTARFHVATRERGRLSFSPAKGKKGKARDGFGTPWTWSGELPAVDAQVHEGQLRFGDYPNAFERIAAGFYEQTGSVWVTARLGKEFHLPETGCNAKGSHGSLHRDDSTTPVFAAGLPGGMQLPEQLRIVDMTPICLEILGINPPRPIAVSHVKHRLS